MRSGRLGEAGTLAARIGNDITRHNKIRLMKTSSKSDANNVWIAVRQLTGRTLDVGVVDGVNAESLNTHYALISTDTDYSPPSKSSQSLMSTISNIIGVAGLSYFGSPPPHCNRSRPTSGLVPQSREGLLFSIRPLLTLSICLSRLLPFQCNGNKHPFVPCLKLSHLNITPTSGPFQ